MAFQKCPVCGGSGREFNYFLMSEHTCGCCQGAKIIDEVTGVPPEAAIPKILTTTGTDLSKFFLTWPDDYLAQ